MIHILTIKDFTYSNLFKNINLAFKENEFHLITGSNKCGKTTLIKLLGGVLESSHSIFYKQTDISSLKALDFHTLFAGVYYTGDCSFTFSNLNQEILYRLDQLEASSSFKKMKYKNLVQYFNLEERTTVSFDDFTPYEKIKSKILLELIRTPKILLLDQVFVPLSEEEGVELISILRKIGGMTVIASAQDLNLSLLFDTLSIISQKSILFHGETKEVLKEDSKLNKIGLSLPFMVDLSLKLKYYNLVDDIILDMDRMVNELWK